MSVYRDTRAYKICMYVQYIYIYIIYIYYIYYGVHTTCYSRNMSSESSRGDEHHVTFSHKFHFDNAQALSSTEVDLIRSIMGS